MTVLRFLIILPAVMFFLFSRSAAGEMLRFRLVPDESRILTYVAHPFGTVKGELTLGGGEVRGEIGDLNGTGSVRLTIDTSSYRTNVKYRDQDVQKNYLEREVYPAITFTSTHVEILRKAKPVGETWELAVRGILDLHGVRKEVQVPVKLTRRGRRITAEGSATILFRDFHISVPTLLSLRANDFVEMSFRFVGVQESQ